MAFDITLWPMASRISLMIYGARWVSVGARIQEEGDPNLAAGV